LEPAVCAQFEFNLRDDLVKTIRTVDFVRRDDFIAQVKDHGLLALDAYNRQVLINLASDAGAETLVAENLAWEGGRYELQSYTYHALTDQVTGRLIAKVATSIAGDDPLVFPDPESGASLIIPKRKTGGFRVFRYPECEYCRMPDKWRASGPFEWVALLMTIH